VQIHDPVDNCTCSSRIIAEPDHETAGDKPRLSVDVKHLHRERMGKTEPPECASDVQRCTFPFRLICGLVVCSARRSRLNCFRAFFSASSSVCPADTSLKTSTKGFASGNSVVVESPVLRWSARQVAAHGPTLAWSSRPGGVLARRATMMPRDVVSDSRYAARHLFDRIHRPAWPSRRMD